jgi:hypothetical protein
VFGAELLLSDIYSRLLGFVDFRTCPKNATKEFSCSVLVLTKFKVKLVKVLATVYN